MKSYGKPSINLKSTVSNQADENTSDVESFLMFDISSFSFLKWNPINLFPRDRRIRSST